MSIRSATHQPEPGKQDSPIAVGHSTHADTETAVNDLLDQLSADDAAWTFVFFNPTHDARVVSSHLDRRVGAKGIAGSTAGELSNDGFSIESMVGLSLHGPDVRASAEIIPNLRELSLVPLVHLPEQFARRIGRDRDGLDSDRHIWILLADGASGAEDLLTPFFLQGSPVSNLVGGSLVGGEPGQHAHTAFHGRVFRDAAALILLEYDRPFELLHHNHLEFTDTHFEVTGVSQSGRVLEELDGRRAAEVYAEAIGCEVDEVTTRLTALHPLGFPFKGRPFVCSPIEVTERASLMMANTVHPGDELQLLEPKNLVESTRDEITNAIRSFEMEHDSSPVGALMFHCLGRFLEAQAEGQAAELAEALAQLPLTGFNTYGEQFNAMHTNHTLSGLLFG